MLKSSAISVCMQCVHVTAYDRPGHAEEHLHTLSFSIALNKILKYLDIKIFRKEEDWLNQT